MSVITRSEYLTLLDRGSRGDEGHFVTIDGHVVFIKDDHGSGANGRGGSFTKHGLEKKLVEHHESRGGNWMHEHRVSQKYHVAHKSLVAKAIAAGNPVPAEVIADYPELHKQGPNESTISRSTYLSRTNPIIHLSAVALAPSATSNLPAKFNGRDVRYYWSDALTVGNWKHPVSGKAINVTMSRLDQLERNLKLARSRGVDIPIVKDHRENADSVVGYLFDARREGKKLMVLHGFIGDDAESLGMRNKVSLGLDPNFKDSHGNRYGEAIRHSALTPIPVIHSQAGFVPA